MIRMMLLIKLSTDDFNDLMREGDAGSTLNEILEEARPEAVYFTEFDGQRTSQT